MNGTLARTVGTVAGAGLVAALVYLPVWLHRHDPPPPALTRRPEAVTVADVPNATLVGRDRGRKVWKIHAGHVQVAADGHTTTFLDVDHGTLYRNDRPAASVTAAKVVYNDVRRDLHAEGGLSLSSGGLTVRTRRLSWSAASGLVTCPEAVTLTWAGGAAAAEGIRADTHLRTITGRHVRVAAQLEEPMIPSHSKSAAAGAALALFLAAPSPAAQAQPAGQASYKEVRLHGDTWRYDHTTRTHVYDGHITAIQGDTTVRADHAVYDEAKNTAQVRGHITVDNPRAHAEGETADIDFNAKRIRLRGTSGVRIVAKPKPAPPGQPGQGARALKDPVTLDCQAVDYFYKEKRAEASGPLTVTRPGQTLTGASATYLASQDLVTITGNVHGKDDKGQTFDAPKVTVYLKEGAEWMEAPDVSATFHVKDEEEPVKGAPEAAGNPR